MSKVVAIADHAQRQRRASEWLAKMDRGLSSQEQRELQAWLAASHGNRQVLLQLSETWDRMSALQRLAEMFPEPEFRRRRPRYWALAAVLLVGLFGLGYWTVVGPSGPVAEMKFAEKRFESGLGESLRVGLPDGSQLVLNTNTLVRAVYTDNQRRLYLERGEVNIVVAPDKEKPFIAYAGDRQVRALGTAFNLEIRPDHQVELIVTEGRVMVALRKAKDAAPSGNEFLLEAGQQMQMSDRGNQIAQVAAEELRVKLSWQEGSLIFRGESLEEAIAEIERYTTVEFVILNEELRKIKVAGLFRTGDVEGLLATLQENFNVSHQRVHPGKVLLSRK